MSSEIYKARKGRWPGGRLLGARRDGATGDCSVYKMTKTCQLEMVGRTRSDKNGMAVRITSYTLDGKQRGFTWEVSLDLVAETVKEAFERAARYGQRFAVEVNDGEDWFMVLTPKGGVA